MRLEMIMTPRPLRRRLGLLVLMALLVSLVVPSAGAPHLIDEVAAAPAFTIDPIIGDWTVTYGAPAVVTMSLSGSVYTETAKSPVRLTANSCYLPPGTIIATFSGSGNSYSGKHGLWYTSNCSFAYWTSLSLTLNGNTLTGVMGDGETYIFTKIG
jgi:hypothetical protein